jgi:hypothetical protein
MVRLAKVAVPGVKYHVTQRLTNICGNKFVFVFSILVIGLLFGNQSFASGAGLKAGAAKRSITPTKQVYLAGTGENRISTSVHDDLYAHCVYLNDGNREVTIVSLDLLGFFINDVQAVRNILKKSGFDPAGVFIASTHTHTAPDVIGLWGPNGAVSGRNPSYLKQVYGAINGCALSARGSARPVEAGFAAGEIGNVCHNIRDEGIQDNTANVMQLREPGSRIVATIVNYGCHPEIMLGASEISSDFVSMLYKRIEEKTGGTAMFLNGALGGMVTPKISANNWQEVERVGNLFSDEIEKIMGELSWSRPARIQYDTSKLILKNVNGEFALGYRTGMYPRQVVNGKITTEMMHLRIGPAEFLSVPGEALPKVGLKMKTLMNGGYKFLISLGDDELGYILPKEDFDPKRYEETRSLGPDTAPDLYDAAKKLVGKGNGSRAGK